MRPFNKRLVEETLREARRHVLPAQLGRALPRKPARVHALTRVGKTICERRTTRRAVLLAAKLVNKAGGAPGPYRPRDPTKCK